MAPHRGKQQGRPIAAADAGGDFRDLQPRIDLRLHPDQFPGLPQFFQEIAQAAAVHGGWALGFGRR